MRPDVCIGLMSGTSLDGVDAVAAAFDRGGQPFRLLGHCHQPLPSDLRETLFQLNSPGPDELHRAALAGNALAEAYAEAVIQLRSDCRLEGHAVAALGAHGQTVRHRPGEFDGHGYTLQLLNGALLAELTGIDVVCDFRSRDLAAHGQGAPLVPAFHKALFGATGRSTAVLNVGGMANLTLLPTDGAVGGFDCGPGNVLMDLCCERHLHEPFDEGGAWAAQGTVDRVLLAALRDDPFIRRLPPKSTGRDHFNAKWLDAKLHDASAGRPMMAPVDIQATLAQFTAEVASSALRIALPAAQQLLVCGGGALNRDLMRRISTLLPDTHVNTTEVAGVDPMQVEAAAFAWLANAFLRREAGNIPAVTGAQGDRILGSLYPA